MMTPRRGRRNYLTGVSAEDQAARAYERRGATILARRHRNEAGEIDLIVLLDGILVFVEVKRRKNPALCIKRTKPGAVSDGRCARGHSSASHQSR